LLVAAARVEIIDFTVVAAVLAVLEQMLVQH
jgi:hypothetical protein